MSTCDHCYHGDGMRKDVEPGHGSYAPEKTKRLAVICCHCGRESWNDDRTVERLDAVPQQVDTYPVGKDETQ